MSTIPPTRPTEDLERLQALAESGAAELGWDAPAEAVVDWAARHVDLRRAAVACSMADAVLPHLVAQRMPGVDVLFLETGYHFTETLATRDEVARRLDVTVVDVLPELTVAEQDERHGKDLFARDPGLCCAMRKVEPLNRALAGYDLWFTGVRRDEAPTRTNTPLVGWDEAHGMVKVNPVAPWSFDDLVGYATDHDVPVNLLLQNGYPSIGCRPCTRPVAPGEDPRAGRWAGTAKTECGIHV
ncbi:MULTISPECIES: phosphoadenylyl-sulfate reductase [Micrococcus]|uniref:phosphoadenylyl-sulfate reductase n=1 Tax=Micrococcus TaxID=1269 RepID=UPI0005CBEFBF|nr:MULTISPECIES: phosphoadenylyl-sulfate reductase [Micrococcus]MBU8793694.1 phosphoadenylyl-sulfate reductase [Micrococcus luteus]MCV7470063.1 phosphoadenylyl-sulfate reductase [Micrococcus luteus]MCV7497988.1 phosphoadenylyl-sulfate reductase [Micrococcus luteus]MCV7586295.1 phosphoadenylyl-sulfate reductase [Micrococcus luteus]MCV7608336.1 phosphoadenylyl-sulfate reductase [Micrococcus luteus]